MEQNWIESAFVLFDTCYAVCWSSAMNSNNRGLSELEKESRSDVEKLPSQNGCNDSF